MGLLRRTESEARQLSRDLREDQSANMRRRRAVIGLSSLGATSLGLIAWYQTGIIKHLPEPPLRYLDAGEVDASPEAYEWLSPPDAVLGVASYGATMTLAAMGKFRLVIKALQRSSGCGPAFAPCGGTRGIALDSA
jgi:hypothetical protein